MWGKIINENIRKSKIDNERSKFEKVKRNAELQAYLKEQMKRVELERDSERRNN